MNPSAAIFDLDGTLLAAESQFSFVWWLLIQGKVRPPKGLILMLLRYLAYRCGLTRDASRLRKQGFRLLKGTDHAEFQDHAAQFVRAKLVAKIRRNTRQIIDYHRSRGDRIILLTSCIEPIAREFSSLLPFDHVIATRLLHENGVLTGEILHPDPYGKGKRDLWIEFSQRHVLCSNRSYGYADHESDAPLLESVGNPVAVNPSRKLHRMAAARGWRIVDLDFEIPIPQGTEDDKC